MLHDGRDFASISAGRPISPPPSGPLSFRSTALDGGSPGGPWPFSRYLRDAPPRAEPGPHILNCQAYAPAALIADCAAILCTSLVSGAAYNLAAFGNLGMLSTSVTAGALIAAIFCCVAQFRDMRVPFGVSYGFERARDALSAWIISFLVFLFAVFVLKAGYQFSRGATLTFFVMGAASVVISRVKAPVWLASARLVRPLAERNTIFVGRDGDPSLVALRRELDATSAAKPHFVSFDPACGDALWPAECARLTADAFALAHRNGPGELFISGSGIAPERLSDILEHLRMLPRTVFLVPDEITASCLRQRMTALGTNVLIEMQKSPLNTAQRAIKRAIDAAGSAVAIAFLLPLLATIAIAIKLDSSGPILFQQQRTGYRGRHFRILKFRSMTVLEDGPDVRQAQNGDKRVTRVGAWLRRTSLDELPQLFNVLKGEMSLIGPRPHALAHDTLYQKIIPNYSLRQHVKPGISGLAQVSGLRGETPTVEFMSQRVEHDLWYVTHCSLLLDIQIMLRTVFEVLRQRNAY